MKFKVNINRNIVDSNGLVHMPENDLKQMIEDCAEKAHNLGKVRGWFLGGIFVAGVYVAIDAACEFLGGNKDENPSK